MATPRAYWKGYLRLSLVTIGIELYPAVSSASNLRLNQIHKPSGKRIHYQKVAPGIGPVDLDDIVKGFKVGDDQYVLLEQEELDSIKLESKETINLIQFVDHCEIDPLYFDRPYYVVPSDNEVAAEGYTVIREALRTSEKVGLGQMAARGRDHIVAIKTCGEGLLCETLRFAEEVRESGRIFDDIPDVDLDNEMVDLATELIGRKSAPFDAEKFESQYEGALRELIEEKRKKGKVTATSEEEDRGTGENVVDLMEALRKSVGKKKTKRRKASSSRSKSSSGGRNRKAS